MTTAIRNIHRATGTITGSAISRHYGAEGLPEDTIKLNFQGSAGQSFGAFIPRGMTMTLIGTFLILASAGFFCAAIRK